MNQQMTISEPNLGKQLLSEGKLEEAIAFYRQAITVNPNDLWSYHDLGQTLAQLGQWDEAIAAYQQAIKLNPDEDGIHQPLVELL